MKFLFGKQNRNAADDREFFVNEVYREFSCEEDVDEWVMQNYNTSEIDVLKEMLKGVNALVLYKGNGALNLNGSIREEKEDEFVNELQDFLYERTIPDSIVVTRFVSYSEKSVLHKMTRNGNLYEYKGFLSTTLLPSEYGMDEIRRRRSRIKIFIPEGAKGTYIPEINRALPEFEILLANGTKLRRIGLDKYQVIL